MPAQADKTFYFWGVDRVLYGPMNFSRMAEWFGTGLVSPESWVYSEKDAAWRPAKERPEFRELIKSSAARPSVTDREDDSVAHLLRELELFRGLTDAQIESFANYAEIVRVSQFTRLAKKGDAGDSMFLVLEGEVRAYLMVDGRECTLASIGAGDFLGEISLLDEGPRSADLAANVDTTLLRISASRFEDMLREAPALAAPFLLALSRTIVTRLRKTTQRYEDSVHLFGKNILDAA